MGSKSYSMFTEHFPHVYRTRPCVRDPHPQDVFNDGWISERKGMPWIRNDIKGERQGSGAGIRLVHGWQHHHIAAAQPDPPKEATSKGKAKDQASLVP